jgi:hypothetical protein
MDNYDHEAIISERRKAVALGIRGREVKPRFG